MATDSIDLKYDLSSLILIHMTDCLEIVNELSFVVLNLNPPCLKSRRVLYPIFVSGDEAKGGGGTARKSVPSAVEPGFPRQDS